MSNEMTKHQLRIWVEKAVKEAQDPDPREKLRRERQKRAEKVSKRFGL